MVDRINSSYEMGYSKAAKGVLPPQSVANRLHQSTRPLSSSQSTTKGWKAKKIAVAQNTLDDRVRKVGRGTLKQQSKPSFFEMVTQSESNATASLKRQDPPTASVEEPSPQVAPATIDEDKSFSQELNEEVAVNEQDTASHEKVYQILQRTAHEIEFKRQIQRHRIHEAIHRTYDEQKQLAGYSRSLAVAVVVIGLSGFVLGQFSQSLNAVGDDSPWAGPLVGQINHLIDRFTFHRFQPNFNRTRLVQVTACA